MIGNLDILSRRAGYNTALRHFKTTTAFLSRIQAGENLADILNEALESGAIERFQLRPILSALLVDKYNYQFKSANMTRTIEDIDGITTTLDQWSAVQLVIAYEHPQAGLFIINPKAKASWDPSLPLLQDELVVVYAGVVTEQRDATTLAKAVKDTLRLLEGEEVQTDESYRLSAGAEAPKRQAPAAGQQPKQQQPAVQAAGGKRRMTPRYSVVVTNELFHNGNVEAWKRIIDSFKSKHPTLDVLIWYENERINDINALFKWGKVKHGVPILVSVVGDDIKDVSKLQRYLYEGASPRFEMFLKGGPDQTLDLF
ncbi:MAG: hypothetical protein ACLFP6_04455 [Spirochaetaceae bacterium]